MTLNKKQKKQIDMARKRIGELQKRLSGARQQMDDPQEVQRLEQEIAAENAQIAKIQESAE